MNLRAWFVSFTPATLISSFVSVTLGTALAWYLSNSFNPMIYAITLIALLLAQGGVNLVHDYYDYLSGVDLLYRASGFSHKRHPIIDLNLSPRSVLAAGYVFLTVAFMAGIYLFLLVGWPVLALAIAGLIIGVGYSVPPLKFHYRGYGEVLAALAIGPLVTWGSYIVQTGIYTNPAPLIVGLPNGLFTILTLIGAGTLELDASRAVGKLTLVLLVGVRRIKYVIYAVITLIYLSIVISAILHYLPYISLVSLLLIPRTVRLAGPLLTGDESVVRSRWREVRKLWAGPFSIRLIMLTILVASMVIARVYPPLSP